MSGPGTVSKPPTLARSAVSPEVRAALEADRAKPRPAPAPTRINEAHQLLAAERARFSGEAAERYATDILALETRRNIMRN